MLSFHPTTRHSSCTHNKMKKKSTRFPDATRQTGGGSIVISHRPSKKLKSLSCVAGMDDKSTTCSKRVKLPKKLLDDSHMVNLVSVPRKSRSVPSAVLKKRISDPSSSNLTNGISRCEMSSTVGNKNLKLDTDEQHHPDEEEAVAALLALTGNDNTHEINLNNKISETTASKSQDLVQKRVQIEFDDLNESRNRLDVKKDFKGVTDGNESRKRCSSHVYICQIIKKLQITKGKMVISRKQSITETTQDYITNVNVGINLNEPIAVSKTIIQDQPRGCGVDSYFGNPFCDPSQWSRPVFPKQQTWMNPFMSKPPQSGSFVEASLHNVVGSKQQQLPFKMQFDPHPPSGYDENGVLLHVDSHLMLKLALQ